MKICKECGEEKSLDDFYIHNKKTGWRSGVCKRCESARGAYYHVQNREKARARVAAWYAKNRETFNARRKGKSLVFPSHLKQYGLSMEAYKDLLIKQNNMCAICGQSPSPKRRLDIDHDHQTGKVRGLLCHPCNVLLGLAKDRPEVLKSASLYLETSVQSSMNHHGE